MIHVRLVCPKNVRLVGVEGVLSRNGMSLAKEGFIPKDGGVVVHVLDLDIGLASIKRHVTRRVGPIVVMHSHRLMDSFLVSLRDVGVRGFGLWDATIDEWVSLIYEVARGGICFNELMLQPSGDILSPREWEVYQKVYDGMRNVQIAQALSMAPGTVRTHLMHIGNKTSLRGRYQMQLSPRLIRSSPTPDPVHATHKVLDRAC